MNSEHLMGQYPATSSIECTVSLTQLLDALRGAVERGSTRYMSMSRAGDLEALAQAMRIRIKERDGLEGDGGR